MVILVDSDYAKKRRTFCFSLSFLVGPTCQRLVCSDLWDLPRTRHTREDMPLVFFARCNTSLKSLGFFGVNTIVPFYDFTLLR